MATFSSPGIFFVGGTLTPTERSFIKMAVEGAHKNGYTKFVEPCAGTFAMSHLAVQAGHSPANIETSDVSMFTSIMGYAITGRPLSELEIKAQGFTDEEMNDPAIALYAWKYLKSVMQAGKDYFYNLMLDLKYNREKYLDEIREQLKRAKDSLHGISYRPLDMWKHLDEVIDDPDAIVIANPPTYLSGFEKWFDTGGRMTWKEPEYGLYNPETGFIELHEKFKDAKALLLCYEESEPGGTAGRPVFARYGIRTGVNSYITTNRPDEVTDLAKGKKVARPNESKLHSLECSMLPRDYVIDHKTQLQVTQIEQPVAQYYRKLWTHNFVGSTAPINFAVLIDGKIAGVFGLDKAALTMGAFGTRVKP